MMKSRNRKEHPKSNLKVSFLICTYVQARLDRGAVKIEKKSGGTLSRKTEPILLRSIILVLAS